MSRSSRHPQWKCVVTMWPFIRSDMWWSYVMMAENDDGERVTLYNTRMWTAGRCIARPCCWTVANRLGNKLNASLLIVVQLYSWKSLELWKQLMQALGVAFHDASSKWYGSSFLHFFPSVFVLVEKNVPRTGGAKEGESFRNRVPGTLHHDEHGDRASAVAQVRPRFALQPPERATPAARKLIRSGITWCTQ